MRFFITLTFVFFNILINSHSEKIINSNKFIIDSLLNNFSIDITDKIKENNFDNVAFLESEVRPEYFFEYIILKTHNSLNIESNSSKILKIKLFINDFSIDYNNLNNGKIERQINLEITSFLIEQDGSRKVFTHQTRKYKDTLDNIEPQDIEDPNYAFTKGKFPARKKTLFEEIIEPAIIISTSIISVVLFFSVRSK